jgi:hypothetical protein
MNLTFAPVSGPLAALSCTSRSLATWDYTVRVRDMDPQATLPVVRGHNSYICPSGARGPRRITRPDVGGGEDGRDEADAPGVLRTTVGLKPDLL